jgi:hypothetical protein
MSHSQYQIKQWFPCYNCKGSGSLPMMCGGPTQYGGGGVMPCGSCGGHGCDYEKYNAWHNNELAKQKRTDEQNKKDDTSDEYSHELNRIHQEVQERTKREKREKEREWTNRERERKEKERERERERIEREIERKRERIERDMKCMPSHISKPINIPTLKTSKPMYMYKPPPNFHNDSHGIKYNFPNDIEDGLLYPPLIATKPKHRTTTVFKTYYGIYIMLWYIAFGLKLWISEKGFVSEEMSSSIISSVPVILWLSFINNILDIGLLFIYPLWMLCMSKNKWFLIGKVLPDIKPMFLTIYTKLVCDIALATYFLCIHPNNKSMRNLNEWLLVLYAIIVILFNIVIQMAKINFILVT